MNAFATWYLNRAMNRIATESYTYGSCHTRLETRTSRFMRWLLGPQKYVFMHPKDEICQCDWRSGPTLRSLYKGKPCIR